MQTPRPGSAEWYALVVEDVVDPDRRIVDPHHHLWPAAGLLPYTVTDLLADVHAGHRVEATVFMECHAEYRADGPACSEIDSMKAMTSCLDTRSSSSMRAGLMRALDRICRMADAGTSPFLDRASQARSSTCSQVSYFRVGAQMARRWGLE